MMSHENRKPVRTVTDPLSILVCDRAAQKFLCCPVLTKAKKAHTLLTHYWTILLFYSYSYYGLMDLRFSAYDKIALRIMYNIQVRKSQS